MEGIRDISRYFKTKYFKKRLDASVKLYCNVAWRAEGSNPAPPPISTVPPIS